MAGLLHAAAGVLAGGGGTGCEVAIAASLSSGSRVSLGWSGEGGRGFRREEVRECCECVRALGKLGYSTLHIL